VLTSVISVFFYLRVVVMMYMADRDGSLAVPARVSGIGMVALAASIVVILYLGILPTFVLDLAAESIATIF
jgi:NADH-quinone oxidoreductase subunit N